MQFQKTPLSSLTTKWHIYHEESMYYASQDEKKDFEELRGRGDSRIYVWGEEDDELLLCVSTDNPRLQNALKKSIPGLRAYSGSVKRFTPDLLDTVAVFIKAKKKRAYSEETKARMRERLSAFRAKRKLITTEIQPSKNDDLSQDGS